MIVFRFIFIGVLVVLSIIFVMNAVTALKERDTKEGYMPDWLIFIGGIGLFLAIMLLPLMTITLTDAQEEIENRTQYELVQEKLYRIK